MYLQLFRSAYKKHEINSKYTWTIFTPIKNECVAISFADLRFHLTNKN